MNYTSVDVSQPHRLRGTLQQTDTGLAYLNPSYKAHGVSGTSRVASTTLRLPGMALASFSIQNRSGSTAVLGIGVRIPNYLWIAGQWTDATTTFVDDTAGAQSTTADSFALETTTNNDGFVIASRVPFNAVSFNVTTASVDATDPARAVRYSNAAGTAWQTADTNLFIQDGLASEYAAGENLIVFAPPVDWGKSSSLATDLPNGHYAMNVRATTAPDGTAGVAGGVEIFRLYYVTEAVVDNNTLSGLFAPGELKIASDSVEGYYGDALVALFGTSNDMNRWSAQVRSL